MTVPKLRPHFWSLALVLLVGLACRDYYSPLASPSPVIRGGELYMCGNGLDGCRVTYQIGPVTQMSGKLRIDFLVTLDGPSGGTTQWTNDTTFHEFLKEQGQRGIVLALSSDSSVFYELAAVGGIAAIDETMVAPVTYQGYWEFIVPEPPGSRLLLTYPDFMEAPVPIVVPE